MTDQSEAAGIFPATTRRVAEHTAEETNRRIQRQIAANIAFFSQHPEQIDQRLVELDAEWDIERTLETNAATLAFVGTVLGVCADRRWLLLPAAVTGFLLQHALQGWCPPVAMFRRLGIRTAGEIEAERYALKILRGDFRQAANGAGRSAAERAEDALNAIRA